LSTSFQRQQAHVTKGSDVRHRVDVGVPIAREPGAATPSSVWPSLTRQSAWAPRRVGQRPDGPSGPEPHRRSPRRFTPCRGEPGRRGRRVPPSNWG